MRSQAEGTFLAEVHHRSSLEVPGTVELFQLVLFASSDFLTGQTHEHMYQFPSHRNSYVVKEVKVHVYKLMPTRQRRR